MLVIAKAILWWYSMSYEKISWLRHCRRWSPRHAKVVDDDLINMDIVEHGDFCWIPGLFIDEVILLRNSYICIYLIEIQSSEYGFLHIYPSKYLNLREYPLKIHVCIYILIKLHFACIPFSLFLHLYPCYLTLLNN